MLWSLAIVRCLQVKRCCFFVFRGKPKWCQRAVLLPWRTIRQNTIAHSNDQPRNVSGNKSSIMRLLFSTQVDDDDDDDDGQPSEIVTFQRWMSRQPTALLDSYKRTASNNGLIKIQFDDKISFVLFRSTCQNVITFLRATHDCQSQKALNQTAFDWATSLVNRDNRGGYFTFELNEIFAISPTELFARSERRKAGPDNFRKKRRKMEKINNQTNTHTHTVNPPKWAELIDQRAKCQPVMIQQTKRWSSPAGRIKSNDLYNSPIPTGTQAWCMWRYAHTANASE